MFKKVLKSLFFKRVMRKEIIEYYDSRKDITLEQSEVINYLRNNAYTAIPYHFNLQDKEESVAVFSDKDNGLCYVVHEGKRIYFKRKWSKAKIKRVFKSLCKEQNLRSPHCYLSESFLFENGEVIADVGAAEGIFALSVVEKAKHIYLFEADPDWVEALEETFAPWKEKVTIVNKYVSDQNQLNEITLDQYFETRPVSFIKADVEGAEVQLLEGSKKLLNEQSPVKIVITTYHKPTHETLLWEMLEKKGFELSYSDGYMLFSQNHELPPPYLRRGLIRASKKN